MRSAFPFVACWFLFAACKKEAVMPSTPEIALISLSPSEVQAFGDHVALRFSYKDGDGDLGQSDPDAFTLEVKDSRLSTADWYHIPPLAPPGEEVAIQGELAVELNTLFLLGNSGEETLTYTIRLHDRAGNVSNTLQSGPIVVHADSLPD